MHCENDFLAIGLLQSHMIRQHHAALARIFSLSLGICSPRYHLYLLSLSERTSAAAAPQLFPFGSRREFFIISKLGLAPCAHTNQLCERTGANIT